MPRPRNPAGHPCYWAFFANPNIYRIDEAVRALETDLWTTKGKPLRKGDRAIVWRGAGRNSPRGIVALAEVLTDPEPLSDADNPYWVQAPGGVEDRVRIRYFVPSGLPLCLTGDDDGLLSSLSVSRARGGTVFHVTETQWDSIIAVLGGDPTQAVAKPTQSPNSGRASSEVHRSGL